MSKVVINGVELELDMLDADVVERYEKSFNALQDQIQLSNYEGLSQAEGMRRMCRSVEEYFDSLFGAGTAEKVFGKANNHLGAHLAAFSQTNEFAESVTPEMEAITNRYSPQRLQARNKQRPKKGKKQRYNNRPQPYYRQ